MNNLSNNFITQTVNNGFCTGCGICESIAPEKSIEIKMNASGFLRPHIIHDLDKATESEIEKICPGMNVVHHRNNDYDPMWGPLKQVATGNAIDEEVRYSGSSGGVISALAIYLIESGKVSFVAQNAVSKDDPLLNALQLSRTRADVIHAAGSRYAPSAPLKQLNYLFETGEKFAFVGKPCDVVALRQYLADKPHLASRVPYMLSFMCAGIPSQLGTQQILQKFSVKPENVKSFRYRGEGWPGKAKVITKQGETHQMDYETSWGTILNKHLQFRCKICPDGTGEFADVVCADAWYGKNGYPEFEESAGRSLVLSRTTVGFNLVQEALKANSVNIEILPKADIAKMQPYQVNRKQMVLGRILATKIAIGVAPRYKNLDLIKTSTMASPIEWLKSAWGTLKRIKKEAQ